MTTIFQAGGGGLPEKHPAYMQRHNLDDEALRVAVQGSLFHVIAPRQVGKTSLLRCLRVRLQEQGWRCVIIDFAPLRNLSMAVWYEALGHQLSTELTPGQALTLTNQLTLRAYLTGTVMDKCYGPSQVALFFDAVENVLSGRDEQGQPFSDAFFSTIRSLYDNNPREEYLTIGLASALSPNSLVKDKGISPFNIGTPLEIDDFTCAETRAFTGYLEQLLVPIDPAVHGKIYAWTHGHPYLTHCICAELERMVSNQKLAAISVESIGQVVQSLFLEPASPLLENSNLRHTANMLNDLPLALQSIWEQIRQGQCKLYASVGPKVYERLYMTGVIIRDKDGCLIIRNQIYQEIFQVQDALEQTNVAQLQSMIPTEGPYKKMNNNQVTQAPDASEKVATPNPWKSGSFYLLAFVIVLAALFLAIFFLPWYTIPLLLVGAIVALIVIGAFQLRIDGHIPNASFMELMRLSFKSFPLLFRSTNTKSDPRGKRGSL